MDRKQPLLIDLGDQVSSVSSKFCEEHAIQSQPLGQLSEVEGTGGVAIPYPGFMEVNLQILGIANYNEDLLLLFIPTMTYSKMVLVMVGSKIIDRALSLMTKGELAKVTIMWRQAHFGAVMSGSLQLSHTNLSKMEWKRKQVIPLKMVILWRWGSSASMTLEAQSAQHERSPYLCLSQ